MEKLFGVLTKESERERKQEQPGQTIAGVADQVCDLVNLIMAAT